MYMDIYALEKIAKARLAELRAECARQHLAQPARDRRAGVSALIGHALIRAGQWLVDPSAVRTAPGTTTQRPPAAIL
jgi:hypothetical protein